MHFPSGKNTTTDLLEMNLVSSTRGCSHIAERRLQIIFLIGLSDLVKDLSFMSFRNQMGEFLRGIS